MRLKSEKSGFSRETLIGNHISVSRAPNLQIRLLLTTKADAGNLWLKMGSVSEKWRVVKEVDAVSTYQPPSEFI